MQAENKYYEQSDLWEKDYSIKPDEKERLCETINLIPANVQTILDVGCGNGFFLNALPPKYETIGIDFSQEALKRVKTKTILGNISRLPFPDRSFDLVTCLEVLEHLPHDVFTEALGEIQRVARKYIIVSVPNQQDLSLSLVVCPACQCHFNPCYHLRSFSPNFLKTLFVNFEPVAIKEIGPVSYLYPQFIERLYSSLIGAKPVFPSHAICPQCGCVCRNDPVEKNSILVPSTLQKTRTLRKILTPLRLAVKLVIRPRQKRYWLIGFYSNSNSRYA